VVDRQTLAMIAPQWSAVNFEYLML
jgi:hypothetical protein